MAIPPIPAGYQAVIPYLVVADAPKLIAFLEHAFDAEGVRLMRRPDDAIAHAEMRIGGSIVMLAEATADSPPRPAMLHLYVEDTDRTYDRAIRAGATSLRPPADQPHGDRMAGVRDSLGNDWWIATHQEDVSEDEIARRHEATLKHNTE